MSASFRLPTTAQDGLLAVFVTVMQIQGTVTRDVDEVSPARPLDDFGNLGYVLLIVSGLVVAGRRRWPLPVFLVTAIASLAYYALEFRDGPGWLGLFVALYTLTSYGDGRRSLRIAASGIAALTVGWLIASADVEPRAAIGWVFFRIGAAGMSAALGESVRARRFIATQAQARAAWAEHTREDEARRRVDAERLRIAREVHDTVAHAIAIINVQSGVTAHVLDKRPQQARETLVAIEQTSSRALQEMRAVLGVLRDTDDERVPRPGLDQLDELAKRARDAGLEIELEANLPELPTAVGSAAYRILQESITNVIRHVGPTRVTVVLEQRPGALEVRVTDDGPLGRKITTTAPRPSGRGIVGMRERCQLLGGDLTAGPRPNGGFEVQALLPLEPAGTVH